MMKLSKVEYVVKDGGVPEERKLVEWDVSIYTVGHTGGTHSVLFGDAEDKDLWLLEMDEEKLKELVGLLRIAMDLSTS